MSLRAEPGSPEAEAIDDFMTYGVPLTVGAGNIADVQINLPAGMKDLAPERLSLGPAPDAPPVPSPCRLRGYAASWRKGRCPASR